MLLLRNYIPALKYGAKITPSEIAGFGLPLTFGKIFYVDATNGSDGNDGLSADNAFATIAAAYAACTTNNNDLIVLSGYADHTITSMLSLSKNRVHIIGTGNYGNSNDQSSKIVMGVTTATTDTAAVTVTGTRCSISNVKIISNNTLSQCVAALYAGGEGTSYNNVTVENNVQLNQTAVYDAIIASDSSTFNNCEIGNDNVQRSVARHTTLFGVSAAAPAKNNYFNLCTFKMNTTAAGSAHIQAGTGDCINFNNIFRSTVFATYVNAGAGAVANTVNVITNASVTGKLMFDINTFSGVGTKMAASANNVGVWVTAASTPTAATSGVAVLAA